MRLPPDFQLPPIDFMTWYHTVLSRQAPAILVGAILTTIVYRWQRARAEARQPFSSYSPGFAIGVIVFVWIATTILAFLGYVAVHSLHQSVGLFFLPVGICFWSCFVVLPSFILARSLFYRVWIVAALALLPIAVAFFALFIEPNRLEVVRDTIVIPTLPRNAMIRIAHFSDIQTAGMGRRDIEALEAANDFEPDMAVITGDLTACGPHPRIVAQLKRWIGALQTKSSVFIVNGDSDSDFDALASQFEHVTYLKDTGKEVALSGARLWIGGVDNKRRPPNPVYCLKDAPAGATRILLSHNPDRFFYEGDWHAELGLAGHTHGGQVQIPFYGAPVTFTKLGRRYSQGVFKNAASDPDVPFKVDSMVVCGGLGMEGGYAPRVRFLRPPQVMLLTLRGPDGP
jgi:hypothetical protein